MVVPVIMSQCYQIDLGLQYPRVTAQKDLVSHQPGFKNLQKVTAIEVKSLLLNCRKDLAIAAYYQPFATTIKITLEALN